MKQVLMAGLAVTAMSVALAGNATAATSTTVTTKAAFLGNGSSFWDGTIKSANKACALNRFNLVDPPRLTARFRGKDGPETLGVAKGSGLNLRDPDRRAKPHEDYYFRNHGTTGCEVFVGGRKGRAAK